MPGNVAWTRVQTDRLRELYAAGKTDAEISLVVGRNDNAVRSKIGDLRRRKELDVRRPVPPSIYPAYDKPLLWKGDALVLPDPEFPFHHAEWIDRCSDLALSWGINHLVLAGDLFHMSALSGWEPNWEDEDQDDGSPNFSKEMKTAAVAIEHLLQSFTTADLILGNHEGRLLTALDTVVSPGLLLRLIGAELKVRAAPYYYMSIWSGEEPYLIEHPRTASRAAPSVLADKYQMHVLMAHSHKIGMQPSRSGRWQGWHIGCCVDERRLAYASQRHNAGDPHALGAAIVRNGQVYPLFEGRVDWKFLRGLK